MQISLEHGIALAIGLMAGGLVIWLVLKGKIALAESQGLASGEIERVTLSEQLKAVNQSVGELRERLTSAELESSELNRNVDDLAQ
jgi:hypothetical protein